MDCSAPPAETDASPSPAIARVSQACVRCRKQKLKCDSSLPCTLCHRAGVRCEPRSKPVGGKSRKTQSQGVRTASTNKPLQNRRKGLRSHAQQVERLAPSLQRARQQPPTQSFVSSSPGNLAAQEPQSQEDVLRSPAAGTTTAQSGSATSRQQQRYGVNSSAVDFAAHLFNDSTTSHTSDISSIPGHVGPSMHRRSAQDDGALWSLVTMECPDYLILEALIDVFFDRMHWFICIFHEPSLRDSASRVFSRHAWRRDEVGTVLACLTVAAVGLQCVVHDSSWHGHELLQGVTLEPQSLLDSLVKEVKFHLWDLLEDCCIETVQVCSMMGTYYIFHASPALSWSILGLSVRTAYALALHCDDDSEQEHDLVTAQIRRRNWNHIMVADTFAATIYGRPLSLDSAFSCVQPLHDLDDMHLGPTLSEHPLLAGRNTKNSTPVTLSTFHVLKFRLYEIIRQALNRFRLLRLQNPVSAANLESLVQAVQDIRSLLDNWKSELPSVFDCDSARRVEVLKELKSIHCATKREEKARRHLYLQLQTLYLTYDSALISVHRPLLEYRGSTELLRGLPSRIPSVVEESLHWSVHAALRMSQVLIADFEGHFVISFMLMNIFTAGVILCIPPTVWPFSATAHEAKAGTLKIIKASRSLKKVNRIALHTEQLLTKLLKLSLQQEVDNGLQQDVSNTHPEPTTLHAGQEYEQSRHQTDDGRPPFNKRHDESSHSAIRTGHLTANELVVSTGEDQIDESLTMFSTREDDEPTRSIDMGSSMTNHDSTASDMHSSVSFLPSIFGFEDQLNQVDSQLDETFGTFGQMLFNLVPNDTNSTWAWGNTNSF